jgi:hypothetical protein
MYVCFISTLVFPTKYSLPQAGRTVPAIGEDGGNVGKLVVISFPLLVLLIEKVLFSRFVLAPSPSLPVFLSFPSSGFDPPKSWKFGFYRTFKRMVIKLNPKEYLPTEFIIGPFNCIQMH